MYIFLVAWLNCVFLICRKISVILHLYFIVFVLDSCQQFPIPENVYFNETSPAGYFVVSFVNIYICSVYTLSSNFESKRVIGDANC